MGATNYGQIARQIIRDQLRYDVQDPALTPLVKQVGLTRFKQAVAIVQARHIAAGRVKHFQLMALLKAEAIARTPGTKYRNPQSAYGKRIGQELDRQLSAALADD